MPLTVLADADAGFASSAAVAELEAKKVEPLVAIARTQPHRLYDFRPPPEPKPERRIAEPWRLAMKAKPESEDGKARYKKRKQTVEPVFGIIKSAMGFTRFHPGLRRGRLCAACKTSPPSGCSSLWPTIAAGCTIYSRPEPGRRSTPAT